MEDSKVNSTLAKGFMLPFLSGSIDHGFSQGRVIDPFTNGYINQNLSYANYGLNASINLRKAGSNKNKVKGNKSGLQANTIELQQQKDNITIGIILAYLDVLNNQE